MDEVENSKPISYNSQSKGQLSVYCFLIGELRIITDTDEQLKSIKSDCPIGFNVESAETIDDGQLEDLTVNANKGDILNAILNYSMKEIKPGCKIAGLSDLLLKHYIERTEGIDKELKEKINKGTTNPLEQIYMKNFHYSSFFTVNGQPCGLDTLGDNHADFKANLGVSSSYKHKPIADAEVTPLNPFGLDYQNNSNACGIWSANILNQVNEFKKAGRENEIVQTYTKDGKSYQMLNPEILLKATAQVSKDLTPKGQGEPELVIPPIMDKETQDKWFKIYNHYTKLKVGNTTFAIDTKYREDSCIDIQAIVLSIPKAELEKNLEINGDFIQKQDEIRTELNEYKCDDIERKSRRKRAVKTYDILKDATLAPSQVQVQTQVNRQQVSAPQVKKSQSSPNLRQKLAPLSNTPERRAEIAQLQTNNQQINNTTKKRRASYPKID